MKNGLAISYSKLGALHQALGRFDQSLVFFELDTSLTKELYEANPKNIELNMVWQYRITNWPGYIRKKIKQKPRNFTS